VRASRVEDPESYDGIDGLLSVAENNGQAIRALSNCANASTS